MNWQFWKSKEKEQQALQVERLQEEVTIIRSELKNVGDQVTKMARIQLKSSKNTEEKIETVSSALSVLNNHQELVQHYKRQQDLMMQHLISLLDEIDHVSSGIKEREQFWYELLVQWTQKMVESLEEIGIRQLDVIGRTFNPEVAESIKTVAKDTLLTPPAVPYQIVEVLNRGYISESGRLIRKAKVVTVEEEEADV